jgi:phage baseplate assembly protein V
MSTGGHIKGLVEAVGQNENLGKVKVCFPQLDGMVSDWLPVVQPLTFDAKAWAVPRKDTQVIVLPGETPGPGLEDAVVLGGIYSKADPPPFEDNAIIGMVADDGVEISYDPGASLLSIHSPKEINIVATDIVIKAEIDIEGNITHRGDIEHKGNLTHTGDADHKGDLTHIGDSTQTGTVMHMGNFTQTGNIAQTGSITTLSATIGGIVFATHKHPVPALGTSLTPVP